MSCSSIFHFSMSGTLQSCYMQFVEKAPEDIVRGVREKAAEAEEKLTLTRNRLNFLKSKILIAN